MNAWLCSMRAIALGTLLTTAASPAESRTSRPPNVAGNWSATMTAGGANLQIVLNRAQPAILVTPHRKLDLLPCGVDGVTRDALCAQYEVYEDRARNAGVRRSLHRRLFRNGMTPPLSGESVHETGASTLVCLNDR